MKKLPLKYKNPMPEILNFTMKPKFCNFWMEMEKLMIEAFLKYNHFEFRFMNTLLKERKTSWL